jgi:hypothetical protein
VADRRLPLRDPGHRRADGLGDVPGQCHHVRPAGRNAGARPRGPVDALRRPRAAARRDRGPRPGPGDEPDAADVRRAHPARAHRVPPQGDPGRRGHRGRGPEPAAHPAALEGRRRRGVDLFVIRGTTVSAEHVSGRAEPLNLKRFIYELDVPVIVGGAATYTAALHLMRTGAAGVLVGFGGGAASTRAAPSASTPHGHRDRRRRRGPAGLPRRVRRPVRPRHRRRRGRDER